jgi:hypothetical protein
MNKLIVALAGLAALAACETTPAEAEKPVTYTVLEADASIPFASKSIRNFRVGAEKTLLLEANGGKWYRATLIGACRSDLPWEQAIGIDGGATDRFDKFASVIIDGRRCQVTQLDQIADPDEATVTITPPAS